MSAEQEDAPRPTIRRPWNPVAPVVEIVERVSKLAPPERGVIRPNDVRIEGQSVLVDADTGVTIHEININGEQEFVRVTLTLLARRVVMEQEVVDGPLISQRPR